MALLWIEGFETFGTSNGVAPSGMEAKYTNTNQITLCDIEAGRIAGKSIETAGAASRWETFSLGSITTMIVGVAFKYASISSTTTFMQWYEPSATLGLNFRLTAAGEIAVYRNTTLLGTTSGAGLSNGTWAYLEFKGLINNTTGTVEIKVAGTTKLSLTSQDTQEGGTTEWNAVRLLGAGSTLLFTFDDWYICDATGAQNNDFLGNVRVDAIQANAAGDSAQYTPSAGSNYQNVDENPSDDDTTYNSNATTGNKDLLNYASMPTSLGAIKGVQINTVCRETDATTFSLKTLVKSSTTESADSAQTIGTTTYTGLHRIVELDPHTSTAWTESTINAAQFGYETG